MPAISFYTLGCRLNQAEEEALRRQFMSAGFLVSELVRADICIINSCSVTMVADRKTHQAIRKLIKENPGLKIVVIGCGAEVAKNYPEVDLWIPNEKKKNTFKIVSEKYKIKSTEENIETKSRRTRALLKIQDGCNNFCAYCIVPILRGREVSVPADEVIREAKKLEKMGYLELVLSGVNVGKYKDNELDLVGLIYKLLKETGFPRIRLSSVNPQDITDELIDLWATEPRLCRHWHLSLQSGTTNVLKKMCRPYTAEQYLLLCKKVTQKIPEMAITTDIIVGFPGETDEDFAETCEFARKVGLAKLHVFRYSKRAGTRAERMENQVQDSAKTARSKELIFIGKELEKGFKKRFIGKEMKVLFEEKRGDFWYGLTSNYIRVKYPSKENLQNKLKSIVLNSDNIA